jgi:cell division transport system permease protein
LQDHIANLGEDPTKFLGYNPLTDAFELNLKAEYTRPDYVADIDAQLSALPYVNKVVYQMDVVEVLDHNLNEIFFVLLIIAFLLLVIALVLISNTIQLQIYSKRFIINTMRLVGATPWVIKWPFILRNVIMGVVAALVACGMIALVYYYCVGRLGIILFPLTEINILFLLAVVLLRVIPETCVLTVTLHSATMLLPSVDVHFITAVPGALAVTTTLLPFALIVATAESDTDQLTFLFAASSGNILSTLRVKLSPLSPVI